jgi:WhiB family redox-sensing transcriptional regulator
MLDWQDDALCAQTAPDMFTPVTGESTTTPKKICALCTVRTQCLEYALTHDVEGIWGGTTRRERRKLTNA